MRMTFPLVAMTAVALALAAPARAETATITVVGEGRVDSAPDMATVMLGVTTEAPTAAEAMAANSAELGRVLARMKEAGIADRDLQTAGLSLNPNWDSSYSGSAPKIRGYVASNQLTVRVRALDTLGGVLDKAVQDGANTFNGLTFGLADPGPVRDEARRRAVADALAKGALYAGAAGVTLGPILSISENNFGGGPQPMYRMDAAMASEAVPVAQGEVSTTAQVTVVFRIAE